MKLPVPLSFEWDQGNIEKSWKIHQITDKEAEEVFFSEPLKIFTDKAHSVKEKRFLAYGVTKEDKKLTIVFTIRKSKIRVISARNQSRKERVLYGK